MKKSTIFLILFALLLVATAVTRFWNLTTPDEVAFDEVYNLKYIRSYLTGEFVFPFHPPLARMIMTAEANLFGIEPEQIKLQFEDPYPSAQTAWTLRALPALAGILVALMIFGLTKTLLRSNRAAFLAGTFAALDTALIVHSRFLLTDMFLLLAVMVSLFFLIRTVQSRKGSSRKYWLYLIATGITLGLVASIKWTGLAQLGVIGIVFGWLLVSSLKINPRTAIWRFGFGGLAILLLAIVTYFSVFSMHLSLLPQAGRGNDFLPKEYKIGIDNGEQPGIIDSFVTHNKVIYKTNRSLDAADHPFMSMWYQWPFAKESIFYWLGDDNNAIQRVYLAGNPLLWWGGTTAIIMLIILSIRGIINKPTRDRRLLFLLLIFLANFLPFALIARPMFLYHYFTAFIVSLIALAMILDKLLPRYKPPHGQTIILDWVKKEKLTVGLMVVLILSFIFFSPIIYGLQISQEYFNLLSPFL